MSAYVSGSFNTFRTGKDFPSSLCDGVDKSELCHVFQPSMLYTPAFPYLYRLFSQTCLGRQWQHCFL